MYTNKNSLVCVKNLCASCVIDTSTNITFTNIISYNNYTWILIRILYNIDDTPNVSEKERDIESAMEKIRCQLNEAYKKQDELLNEISILKVCFYLLCT